MMAHTNARRLSAPATHHEALGCASSVPLNRFPLRVVIRTVLRRRSPRQHRHVDALPVVAFEVHGVAVRHVRQEERDEPLEKASANADDDSVGIV
jgi:hypothetical protein